ncbi:MAG TPA: bifunctional DNA-binding transcriptional regulator/O6-methylguanine-DNA methyltransferase Ada [Candidatus Cybelea sp.]|nr:bifunctional DNA-binding transcriptional regulator/O6-methylguanine-DNA methyltransferase Ada [Candidatus Cybelea sp.]
MNNVIALNHATALETDRLQAVLTRDRNQDGRFVYGVLTTRIYCRPSCSSRKPKPDNLRFFPVPEAAENAGFRPCKRCRPETHPAADPQVRAVRRACAAILKHLDEGAEGPPRLEQIAEAAGMSPWHLQRTFTRLLGISPRSFADARRLTLLKGGLKQSPKGVADAIYSAGYGSASRVYERSDRELGMTPATYAKGGAGAEIVFAIATSPLGKLLVAATTRGVCMVSLGESIAKLEAALREDYPAAHIRRDDAAIKPWIGAVLRHLEGREPHLELPLDVRATAFQWRVWQALKEIPMGRTLTYKQIAEQLGQPTAARAVGHACATNPVALIVPCHRAVRGDGGLGGYRWGLGRKEKLIAAEREFGAGRRSR